jgi:hypothetical protein
MAISINMRFILKTLVDITPTYARRTEDRYMYNQHQNYMTVVNTLGLRSNPLSVVVTEEIESTKYFGSTYTGEQKVWTIEFEVEREGSLEVPMLKEDFNLVPFIRGLSESVELDNSIFQSTNKKYKNIYFEQI